MNGMLNSVELEPPRGRHTSRWPVISRAELVVDLRRDDVVAGDEQSLDGAASAAGVVSAAAAAVPAGGGAGMAAASPDIPHDDEALVRNPLHVRAHAFRDDADRNENVALVDHRRHVQWTRFAVDHDFGFADGTLTSAPALITVAVLLPASYDTVAPICSNIERNGIKSVPLFTSAANTRPCLRTSGLL